MGALQTEKCTWIRLDVIAEFAPPPLPVAMVAMDRLNLSDTNNTVLIDLPNEDSLETPF